MRQTSSSIPTETEWLEAPSGGGMRLDLLLATIPEVKSRNAAQKMIEAGRVRISGKKELRSSRILRANDCVEYMLPAPDAVPAEAGVDLHLSVLHEDDDCFVIEKPAGIAVHTGNGMSRNDTTILDGLRFLFRKRKLPFSVSEVLVHRLDKETTGCLLIAKNPKAHMALQKQFEKRTVSKFYLALVSGVPSPAAAMIDAPIGRHTGDRTKMSIIQTGKTRNAATTYRTLTTSNGMSLLSCELHTGRTHQIRVHLLSIGHPILGDAKYETMKSLKMTALMQIDFLCLHAWKLSFVSPTSKKKISVSCQLPKKFENFLSEHDMKLTV